MTARRLPATDVWSRPDDGEPSRGDVLAAHEYAAWSRAYDEGVAALRALRGRADADAAWTARLAAAERRRAVGGGIDPALIAEATIRLRAADRLPPRAARCILGRLDLPDVELAILGGAARVRLYALVREGMATGWWRP